MGSIFRIAVLTLVISSLSACGGGGSNNQSNDASSGNGDSQQTGNTNNLNPVEAPDPNTNSTASQIFRVSNQKQAAKFLNRSTFGPTKDGIDDLISSTTYFNWLKQQFELAPTYHFPLVKSLGEKMCANFNDDGTTNSDSWEYKFARHHVWWDTATYGEDQLRQRVAFALSEILVISDSEGLGLNDYQLAVTSYYDVLVKHAFGNYKELLKAVALHPAMGDFLSMSRNQKSNAEGTIRPDENYARENLQLFTIGVHQLNLDGTKKRDANNNFIPTYNQKTIEEFAKVFTGWSYSDKEWNQWAGKANRIQPLIAFEEHHDTSSKTLLNGEISPYGLTAEEDLDFAINNIFKHPNIAPYISKQLIQRLVTSNPSPAYVERVARVFNNNGLGIKGDMKAIVRAILLDTEALSDVKPDNFGKLREPLLRMSHLWRAFNMQASLPEGHFWHSENKCGQGAYPSYNVSGTISRFNKSLGQGPLQARSVFNFFRPDFSPTGLLNENGLYAPEFQIINENTTVSSSNLVLKLIENQSTDYDFIPALDQYSQFNLTEVTDLARNTDSLLDYLSLVLLNNDMSETLRSILKEHLDATDLFDDGRQGQFQQAKEAIMLIISSPEYLIQK